VPIFENGTLHREMDGACCMDERRKSYMQNFVQKISSHRLFVVTAEVLDICGICGCALPWDSVQWRALSIKL
jgi:hypothetical protein